jgi:hypothetical protein
MALTRSRLYGSILNDPSAKPGRLHRSVGPRVCEAHARARMEQRNLPRKRPSRRVMPPPTPGPAGSRRPVPRRGAPVNRR